MFPNKFHICDAFGIPVYVDLSFLILMLILVMDFGSFTLGIACALALGLSITLHELGHSLTARAFGYRTRLITLSLLGGCASLCAMPRKAWQELLTAVAGPLVSFALAAIAFSGVASLTEGSVADFVLYHLTNGLVGEDSLACTQRARWLVSLLLSVGFMNTILGIFNLLPGFPMDGGRIFRSVIRAFMSRAKATYVAMIVGRAVAIGLGFYGLWRIVNTGSFGWITVLIAWMIWREGYREYLMALQEERWGFDDPYGWSARVSSAPYSDDGDEDVDVRRGR